jgi:hypothetical protein
LPTMVGTNFTSRSLHATSTSIQRRLRTHAPYQVRIDTEATEKVDTSAVCGEAGDISVELEAAVRALRLRAVPCGGGAWCCCWPEVSDRGRDASGGLFLLPLL